MQRHRDVKLLLCSYHYTLVEIVEVADYLCNPVYLAVYYFQIPLVGVILRHLILAHHINIVLHGGKGIVYFVGDTSGKLPQGCHPFYFHKPILRLFLFGKRHGHLVNPLPEGR